MYIVKLKKILTKYGVDVVNFTKKIKCDFGVKDDIFQIRVDEGGIDSNELVDRCFRNIEIDIENKRLLNGEEIKNKWLNSKMDLIYEAKNQDEANIIMDIAECYEEPQYLEFVLLHYSFIPFLIFSYRHRSENLKLFNEFLSEYLEFSINVVSSIDKKEQTDIYNGMISSTFDMISYKQKMREILEIDVQEGVFVDSVVKGKNIFYEDNLESGEIEICLKIKNKLEGVYKIEIEKIREME